MPQQKIDERLIVALDVDSEAKAKKLVDELVSDVKLFKVGNLFLIAPSIISYINNKDGKVFLDLKFHDIPNTVSNFVSAATEKNIFMMTVHTQGGKEMLQAAARAAKDKSAELKIPKPLIVGVTVLTSEMIPNVGEEVLKRARLAQEAGLDGVVCSVHEAQAVRKEFGKDFIIVMPGIRPKDAKADDQKRVATAEAALKAGANFIVVGRPIIEAADPRKAAQAILKELK